MPRPHLKCWLVWTQGQRRNGPIRFTKPIGLAIDSPSLGQSHTSFPVDSRRMPEYSILLMSQEMDEAASSVGKK